MRLSTKSLPVAAPERRDERGAAAMILALFIAALMIPLAAVTVDMARWWVEAERVQAAADAASTAGVTHMPDDFDKAKARALEIAADNGFTPGNGVVVDVKPGDRPTQLLVTITGRVTNFFGSMIGVGTTDVARHALADFNGPAPMGSPCNNFGNEPAGNSQNGPAASQIKVVPYATCPQTPQFWGAIAGPETHKDQGAQFEARKCTGGEVACASSVQGAENLEFDPRGYVYMVRVTEQALNRPVTVQIYDPAYVETDAGCGSGPTGSINSGDNYRYPQATGDANDRYRRDTNSFCTGDSDNNGRRFGNEVPTVTSFALREPIDTLNPFAATAHLPTQCTKQWPGYVHGSNSNALSLSHLRNSGNGSNYRENMAKVFHQWVNLCTFTPTKAGDWYIQVRTNVALGSGSLDTTGAIAGNTKVTSQVGDDTAVLGNGTNNFSIRAYSASAPAGSVSVAAWERMRIYANADSATSTFNLVRVVPAAQGKTLVISFYDVGEATSGQSASPGSVKVIPPADSNLPANIAGCVGSGVVTGNLTNCTVSNIKSSNFNGQTETVRVPIPNNYTCQSTSQGGCWFRVQVSFPGATVTDATTWTARISGEPVRLLE